MVTIQDAERVMKEVYLDVITNQLNFKTNAFYNMIRMGSEDVDGSTISSISKYGLNGGMGSGAEGGLLPIAGGNNYIKFKADLKNIYGTIEVTDKLLRASSNSAGAMVNVLNAEMEGLLDAAKFNFSRMLFQNGNGELCKIGDMTDYATSYIVFPVTTTKNLMEGMIIDICSATAPKVSGLKISSIDRVENTITLAHEISSTITIAKDDIVTLQQSLNSELYGIPYIFDSGLTTLYGLVRANSPYLLPTIKTAEALSTDLMQQTLDSIEEKSGNNINLIMGSYEVRRAYFNFLTESRLNIDYMNLDGGFKAFSYNGIPFVVDRFIPDKQMYFLNTDDFKLQQLNDWSWLEGNNGKVLRQVSNKAAYTATLVKYANLVCVRPVGQGLINFVVAEA